MSRKRPTQSPSDNDGRRRRLRLAELDEDRDHLVQWLHDGRRAEWLVPPLRKPGEYVAPVLVPR